MSLINIEEPDQSGSASWSVFFAAGFRPFFLFTALQAVVTLPLWLAVYVGGLSLHLPYAESYWHAHEMVFGFSAAAIGGFLLTAVPNWTNSHHLSGRPLAILFALWLAGRLAFTLGGVLPPVVVAGLDLAYLPVLLLHVGRPLVRAGKVRNLGFLPILGGFWLCNLWFHLAVSLGLGDALHSLYLGITIVLCLIVIVGGRVIPSFTQNWLHMQGSQRVDVSGYGWIERGGAVGSVAVSMCLAAFVPTSPVAGVALIVAAIINGVRMSRWHGWKTGRNPIVWILHVGYGWMVIGLAILGLCSFVGSLPPSSAIHSLTAGAIASMIMAIMTRASLGHSGRMLKVSRAITIAYALLSVGTLLRVIAPLTGGAQIGLTHGGGTIWTIAWILFVIVYFPILTRPRADGRPG